MHVFPNQHLNLKVNTRTKVLRKVEKRWDYMYVLQFGNAARLNCVV